MGDSRPEGERNFWDGRQSVTARGPQSEQKPLNLKEADEMIGEGGSDYFTSNRHQIHQNQTESEFRMKFWSGDDSPVIRPRQVYSETTQSGIVGDGCEKVTRLKLRSHMQWVKQAGGLAAAGLLVFAGLTYMNGSKETPQAAKTVS